MPRDKENYTSMEEEYRRFMLERGESEGIIIPHLFEAMASEPRVEDQVNELLDGGQPVVLLLQGSATPDNLKFLAKILT